MIGRRSKREAEVEFVKPKGFDDYKLCLGDMMRGERATMGKSLLDVQREIRIKASYIAAIENADPSVFESPGFIAGYVRSYARYLNLDPEMAFDTFCEEAGFTTAHGMSAAASTIKKKADRPVTGRDADPFASPTMPFAPKGESFLARIEPGAIGSSLVLLTLIGGIGFGGWSVLNEVQRVQVAPIDQIPVVASDLDPLQSASQPNANEGFAALAGLQRTTEDNLDRLYRPQALDVPVLTARDAPISTLTPGTIGAFSTAQLAPLGGLVAELSPVAPTVPQVVDNTSLELVLVAVRPAWVRVRAADGSVIFEKILDAGEEYVLPATEDAPTLRAGMSGSVYFRVNGEIYGPAGVGSNTVRDVALDQNSLTESYAVADLNDDTALADYVAVAAAQSVQIGQ